MNPAERLIHARSPARHAAISRLVTICLAVSDRKCAGDECDEGEPCARHRRASAVADRYAGLVARWGRK